MSSKQSYLKKLSKNLNRLVRRFSGNRKAGVAVSFSIIAVPTFMTAAMGVDYVSAVRTRTALQAAADTAVLAGAAAVASGKNEEKKRTIILKQFFANLPSKIKHNLMGEPETIINFPEKSVTLRASINTKSYFGSILQNFSSLHVVASAIAKNGTPICMMSLNPSIEKALYMNGTADIIASNCAVHVNSTNPNALSEDGTGFATADEFCVRGGYSGTGFSPKPHKGCFKEEDPLATRMDQAWDTVDTTCTHTGKTVINADTALAPGVYCGGFEIKKGTVTLQENGIYVFRNGPLHISAHGKLSGNKVAVLLHGDSTTRMTTQGGADIDISAKTEGPFAGVAIAMHKSALPAKENLVTGGGYMSIDGIIYFPKQHLSIQGNGVIGQDTDQFAIIADTISVQGTGLLTIKITAEYESFTQLPELPKSLEKIVLVQ